MVIPSTCEVRIGLGYATPVISLTATKKFEQVKLLVMPNAGGVVDATTKLKLLPCT
jgi:hypothetical protein